MKARLARLAHLVLMMGAGCVAPLTVAESRDPPAEQPLPFPVDAAGVDAGPVGDEFAEPHELPDASDEEDAGDAGDKKEPEDAGVDAS